MHRYLLLAAFSIAAGYLLTAPDVQPESLGRHTYVLADTEVISQGKFR
ncbi:hypothetical protein [Rhizobium sp. L1K21]|nr:hypothetical protein [Rhizobium sp. L1K21]MCO6187519.1 hypothetical protein [Rhizobium sp. L1K21]